VSLFPSSSRLRRTGKQSPSSICWPCRYLKLSLPVLDNQPVKASRGVMLLPDTPRRSLSDDFDMIALPGGMPGMTNPECTTCAIIALLQKNVPPSGKIRSCVVCVGDPVVLAEAGLLSGKPATATPASSKTQPARSVFLNDAVVTDGKIITSARAGHGHGFYLAVD